VAAPASNDAGRSLYGSASGPQTTDRPHDVLALRKPPSAFLDLPVICSAA
jgi:hypothetical protein